MMVRVISVWQPIASIVTMQSLRSKEFSNNGIAVISLLLSSTFTCPKEIPLAADHAETIHNLNPSFPVVCSPSQTDLFDPIAEDQLKIFGLYDAKESIKSIMAGDELQIRYATFEKSNFGIAEFLNLIPGLGPQITAAMDI